MSEQKLKLPKGWELKKLGDIFTEHKKKWLPNEKSQMENYVGLENIESNTGNLIGFTPTNSSKIKSSKGTFTKDMVLYGKLRPYLNKILLPDFDGICSTDILALAPKPITTREFLANFLRSPRVSSPVNESLYGAKMPRTKISVLQELPLLLPPLPLQKRIVSKIEELFLKIDSAKQSLECIRSQLEQYRLSLLKSAFDGRLTRKWRDDNKNKVQIEFQKYKEVDSKLKEEIGILHGKNRPTIPLNWSWARIKEIAKTGQGGTPSRTKKEFWNGTIPWLRSGEVKNNIIENTNETITKLGLAKSSTTKCPSGSVLLAMTGEGITRGRVSILGIEACANQSVCHMIVNHDLILNKYLFYYLQAYYWTVRKLDKGSNQPGLNVSMIKEFEIPICSLTEQHEIVKIIEKKLNDFDNNRTNIKLRLNDLEMLRKSILKQAFGGKLVPQDPNDEPASVLLERIKKEKIKT